MMIAFLRPGALVLLIAGLLCLFPALAPPAWAGGGMLIITNTDTGQSAKLSLNGISGLDIRFFHSYDRQWVVESFKVEEGRFVPTAVSYADDSYDYRDQRYRSQVKVEPGLVRLKEIAPLPSDRLKTINTRVAHTTPQQLLLTYNHEIKIYLFTQWGQPGQSLVFSLE